jgi:antitoxin YefM
MKYTTFTKARTNLKELLDEVVQKDEPVIIRRGKGRDVAVISAKELSSLLETIHVLRSPNNTRRLFDALERAERGEGTRATVEELRAQFGLERGE